MDDLATREIEGELDADLAEMSLGQRLTAITGEAANAAPKGASSDDEDASPSKKTNSDTPQAVPAASLTRTLIQALHSSDSGLLETCLAHSNATLIQNTVKRLPSQLAVPLVTACVERLGRGKRVGRGKGSGGGAGAQRGTGLVRWVRAVLVVHGGHLLTVRVSIWSHVSPELTSPRSDSRPCCPLIRTPCDSDFTACSPGEPSRFERSIGYGPLPNRDAFIHSTSPFACPQSRKEQVEQEKAVAEESQPVRRGRKRERG